MAEVAMPDGNSSYPYRFALGQRESGAMQIRFDWLTHATQQQRENFLESLAQIEDLELESDEVRAQQ